MSTWLCPEHGLYAGQVLCPSCGKNGARVEEEATTMTTPSELKALLERGTPGLWREGDSSIGPDDYAAISSPTWGAFVEVVVRMDGEPSAEGLANLDLILAMHAALPSLLARIEQEAWQPIETAPKDGTTILAWWPGAFGGKIAITRWNRNSFTKKPRPYWSPCADERLWGTIAVRASPPTHWRPLLPPPGDGM